MDSGTATRITTISMVTILILGSWKRVLVDKKWPETKFLLTVGLVYLVLSAIDDIEPEFAAPVAIGLTTTAIFEGDGKGFLEYINKHNKGNKNTSSDSSTPGTAQPVAAPLPPSSQSLPPQTAL